MRDGGPGADSRRRIVEAAAAVAAEHGYEGTTITKVTRRCGLPVSSVYWHFKDKDDLLAAVIPYALERWTAEQPPWTEPRPGAPVGETLRAALVPAYRRITEAPELMRIGFMLLLESRDAEPTARARFREVRGAVVARTSAAFETLLSGRPVQEPQRLAEHLAHLVMVATDGLFLLGRIEAPVDVEEYVELLVAVVEQAVEDACTDADGTTG